MKISYKKNGGPVCDWALTDNILTFDGALSLDLEALSADGPRTLYISRNDDGETILGCGDRYIAEVKLPPREYRIEKIGYTDDFGYPALRKICLPVDADSVELTLWPIEG